jgi:hypothetical protein
MIPGLNTNIRHAGVEYHVQTEDLGRQNPFVLTLVFRAGAIVAREKANYREALGEAASETQIKALMHQQHYRIIRSLQEGRLLDALPLQAAEKSPAEWPSSLPTVGLPPADKSLDQLILEYLRRRANAKAR